MREINKIAESLFEKVRDRFDDVSLGDENAKATQTPEDARFFNFNFVVDGHDCGNITISLIDENSLKVYFSKNISDGLEEEQKNKWYAFLRELREFARRNLLSFDPRDITRSSLKHRDIHQQSKADSTYTKDEVIGEGRMYGTSRSSYENEGPVRIIVRHSGQVDPEQRGSRSRHIKAIYLETADGERRKLCCNSLRYARAMGRHLQEGGLIDDEFGQHITEIALECNKLKPFKNGVRGRTFEDTETQQMVEAAFEYHGLLNNTLKRIGGKKGYAQCKENFQANESVLMDDFDLDEMRERFVKRVYKDSMDEALPIAYKAYKMKKENKLGAQFESWANRVTEGTWAYPETDEQVDELIDLLSEELPVGIDAANATNLLYNLLGDDKLFDALEELAEQDPDADAREVVFNWIENNEPELSQQLLSAMGDDPNYPEEPGEDEVDESTYGDAMGGMDGEVHEDYDEDQIESIQSAIIRRILGNIGQHTELLRKAGPDGVMNAARDVASFHAPVEELGSSDISIMVREVYNEVGVEYPELNEGRMKDIALDIEELSNKQFVAKYGKSKDEMKAALAEGLTGLQKLGAGAALVGALAGNAYIDQKSVDASPQMQKLEQLYHQALANDDTAKADELADRIDDLRTRIELGKGEVLDKQGNPVEPKYESINDIKRLAGL